MKNLDFRGEFCLNRAFWSFLDQNKDKDFLCFSSKNYSFKSFSNRVFQYFLKIKEEGVQKRIGFVSRDDFDSYCRLFAISLTGASYVPVSDSWPEERKRRVTQQADLKFVLDDIEDSNEEISSDLIQPLIDQEEAYVLFTSGSTGEPKGVPLQKRNINALLDYYVNESSYKFNEKDNFLQTFELNFDFSLFPLLMAIHCQGSLTVLNFKKHRYLEIPNTIFENEITVLTMVPSVLGYLEKYMKDFNFPSLRYSIFGGAPLHESHYEKWLNCLPNGEIRNVYGPTETGVICSDYDGRKSKSGIVAMGYLFSSFNYVIHEGELCLSGPQVFEGYLESSKNNFLEKDGRKYYCTGDLVSVDDDGLMYFEGRKDFQFKSQGYRIEPEEVESQIKNELGVESLLVLNDEDLVLIYEAGKKEEEIEEVIKKNFPSYMRPHFLVQTEALILNDNNKVDRKENTEWLKKFPYKN